MKNIELSTDNLVIFGRSSLVKIKRFAPIITIIGIVAVYVFLILQISNATQQTPSEELTSAQSEGNIKRLKIDQESVTKIQQLEDQSVGVQALFNEARQNPFQGQ